MRVVATLRGADPGHPSLRRVHLRPHHPPASSPVSSPASSSAPPKSSSSRLADPVCGAPGSLTVAAHWISVPRPDFRLAVAGAVGVRWRRVPCGRRGIGGLGSRGCLKRSISFDDAFDHGVYRHGLYVCPHRTTHPDKSSDDAPNPSDHPARRLPDGSRSWSERRFWN